MARDWDPMNLDNIISSNSTSQSSSPINHSRTDHAPALAALIRTATPSSIVKRIFFAKIWRKVHDILCIKIRSFEIKQVDRDYDLKLIASQDDIDGSIISSLVYPEYNDLERLSADSEHESGPESYRLPPQIIVLALQRGLERSLIFTFAYSDSSGAIRFAICRYPLACLGNNTMGTNMAVDPRGRILAVSSLTGNVMLAKLKSWTDIREEVESNESINEEKFHPVAQETRNINIAGLKLFLHMDFVVPPENEPDFAYLVVVGDDHSGRVFLVLRIDCSRTLMGQDFNPIYRVVLGTRMTQGLDKFLFVIPLKHRSGLFLCAEKHLALVMDIKNPRFELQLSYLGDSDIEAVDDPGCYGSDPLYTAWTRPLRRKEWWHESHKDVAYLCREDGQIKLLSLTAEPGRRSRVEVMFLYHIRSRVDQAFTAVDIPRSVVSKVCDDSFITGGDQSNGVLVTIEPNQDPKLRSIIPNLNPVIDYAVAPNNLNDPCQNNRIFATTHRGRRHGAISEVRHGYEMRVLEDVSTNDYDVVSICYLPFEDSGYLIISGPTGSSQLYHYDGEDSISNSSGDESRYPSWLRASGNEDNFLTEVLQESEDIKAIAIISDNSYIVVTNNYIQRLSSDLRERQDLLRDDLQGSKIVKACIDSQSSRVLYAVATSAMYSVNVLEICASQQKPLISLSSSSEPSCICSYTGDNISLAVVGTRDGCLEFYHQHRSTLERLCSYNLQEEDGVCENILLLVRKQEPQRSNAISLLCGLRSGELRLLDLDFEGQDLSVSQRDTISLGTTSVRLMLKSTNETVASGTSPTVIIYCENDIYLYNDTGHKFSENSLKRLWFVDYRGPTSSLGKAAAHSDGIYQEAIQAITVLPPRAVFLKSALEEDILCLTKSGIKRCRIMIAGNARNVPWQIPVGGYPLRLIWSARHKRLIVGVLLDLVVDSSSGAKPRDTKKITFSAIKIINPKSESDEDRLTGRRGGNQISIPSSETLPSPAEFAAIIESSVERISSIAEWQLTAGGKLYHMLLVSTFERIRMYNFQTADGPLELKATVSDQAKEPILGVAVYDSTSFITLTRGSLVMYKIDERDGKTNFRQIIRKSLGSVRGSRTVKIRKSQIIIGSSEHGVQIFEYKNISFHHMFSDAIGGHTYDATTMHSTNQGETTHLIIQARHSIQFGQSDSQIIAHFQPSTPTPSNQLTTIFQCTLPTQITCLRQTSLRPSLRPTNHPHNHPRILASAIDGAFYNIDLIPLKTWKLLKLLTNLIEHEQKTLCPFNSSSSSRTVTSRHAGIIPLDEGPESRTVNGDWLSRLLRIRDETPVSFVRRLIAQDHAQVGKRGWVPGLEGIVEQLVIDVVGSDEVVSAGGTVEALVGLVRDVVDGP